jgi:hypothetical protein
MLLLKVDQAAPLKPGSCPFCEKPLQLDGEIEEEEESDEYLIEHQIAAQVGMSRWAASGPTIHSDEP